MSNQLFTTIRWCGVLSDGYETWMARGIDQFGRDIAAEEERDRLMAWSLGVSFNPIGG